jgi:peptide-methionine (S)-S-oxide reductase
MVRVGFGGGCHWCTEAVFQFLRGVGEVQQGFIRSKPPSDSYSEAVIVNFDSGEIGLAALIEVHVRTHASTSAHKLRGKYRSAVYAFDTDQAESARYELDRLQSDFDEPIVTQVLSFAEFKMSNEPYRNYYRSDPARPFCTAYIDPKLKLLRERFVGDLRPGEPSKQTVAPS